MAEKAGFFGPSDESRTRLESWCRRSVQRLSPLTGARGATRLVDAIVAERLGRRIDQVSPEGFQNGAGPTYAEIRAFFTRFAPGVASYLRPGGVSSDSVVRLHRIQIAMCRQIALDNPTTLGRSGMNLLSREWKRMEAEQARLDEALSRLASAPEGESARAACRSELDAILDEILRGLDDQKTLLELRRAARRSLTTSAPRRPRGRTPRAGH